MNGTQFFAVAGAVAVGVAIGSLVATAVAKQLKLV